MDPEEIGALTPNQLSVELACMANRLGIGDQQGTDTIIELDETLLLQPIEFNPEATDYPQRDPETGEEYDEDED